MFFGGGWGGGVIEGERGSVAIVSIFFVQRIQNLKKNFFFEVGEGWWGGGGGGGKCFFFSFFYKESKSTHFWRGRGGGGMEGVMWRGGSVARVDVNSFYK